MNIYIRKRGSKIFPLLAFTCFSLTGCNINPTISGVHDGKYKSDITFDIVNKVRCETRDALVYAATNLIERESNNFERADIHVLPQQELSHTVEILKKYPGSIDQLKFWEMPYTSRIQVSIFAKSSLADGFTIEAQESNTNSVTPAITASHGTHQLSLSIASQSFSGVRKNKRTFDLPTTELETYTKLDCPHDYPLSNNYSGPTANKGTFGQRQSAQLANAPKSQTEKAIAKKNRTKLRDFAYPLRGNIELGKTVASFFNFIYLNANYLQRRQLADNAFQKASAELQGYKGERQISKATAAIRFKKTLNAYQHIKSCENNENKYDPDYCDQAKACLSKIHNRANEYYMRDLFSYDGSSVSSKASQIFTETLTFTTTLDSGIDPKVTFSSPASLSLESIGFSFKPQRKDTHTLTMAFSSPAVSDIGSIYSKKSVVSKTHEIFSSGRNKILVQYPQSQIQAVDNSCRFKPVLITAGRAGKTAKTRISRTKAKRRTRSKEIAISNTSSKSNFVDNSALIFSPTPELEKIDTDNLLKEELFRTRQERAFSRGNDS